MSLITSTAALAALAFVSTVSAHGMVQGIVANGVWYQGYGPAFPWKQHPPPLAAWSTPEDKDTGFVNDYTNPDIICHRGATPGALYVTVAAGSTVELQWTKWSVSHHGPVMDYLASCGDDCTTVDKTKLAWNKIDEAGLVTGSPAPGKWASDTMIANNNSWVVTIPSSIAPGKYVLRHETIALHAAQKLNGAQNYPQCVNLEITGDGTNPLSGGTLGTELYNNKEPGILVNIYWPVLTNYTIPGPPLLDGAVSGSQPTVPGTVAPSMTSSYPSVKPTGKWTNSTRTSTSASVEITAIPSKPAAAVAPSSQGASAGPPQPSHPAGTEPGPGSESDYPPPPPSNVAASTDGSPPPTGVSPISFTQTITGRIGQSTKLVCYIEE